MDMEFPEGSQYETRRSDFDRKRQRDLLVFLKKDRDAVFAGNSEITQIRSRIGASNQEQLVTHHDHDEYVPVEHDRIIYRPSRTPVQDVQEIRVMMAYGGVFAVSQEPIETDIKDVFIDVVGSDGESSRYLLNDNEFTRYETVDDLIDRREGIKDGNLFTRRLAEDHYGSTAELVLIANLIQGVDARLYKPVDQSSGQPPYSGFGNPSVA
jgi:hypothetical protein